MTDNVINFLPPPHVPRIITGRKPATIINLPNIRVEQHPDKLPDPYLPRRKTLREMSRDICGND